MALTHVTDHYEQAVARLPQVYKDKPRYLAWLAAYCDKIQQIEDVLWAIYNDRLIQNSPTGDLLIKLAALVNQPSWGAPDAVWLLYVQAHILALRSRGKRRDHIAVTKALWPIDNQPTVMVLDMPPDAVIVAPQLAVSFSPATQVSGFVGPATAAGVRLEYVWTGSAVTSTFLLASTHYAGFASGSPPTTPDVGTTQVLGSTHHAGFAAGPPPGNDGGGALSGVVAW